MILIVLAIVAGLATIGYTLWVHRHPVIGELTEEQITLLYRAVDDFLKAGGTVTFMEWQRLHPVTRAAFLEARRGGPSKEVEVLQNLTAAIDRKGRRDPA